MNRNRWLLGVAILGATGLLLTATPRVQAQTFVSVRAIAVPVAIYDGWTFTDFGRAVFTGAVGSAAAG